MSVEEWFVEQFWPLYPNDLARGKKGPKSVALKSMVSLDPDEHMQGDIISKMRVLIRSAKMEKKVGQDPDRWPFASTWINQERWNSVEDMEQPSSIVDKRLCSCGKIATHKNQCWQCLDKNNPANDLRMANLKDIFIKNGLLHEESKVERTERCKDFLRQRGYLGIILREG
jgi:hypothetical protein